MPILRVDQFGRLYESGRDSENGTGYNRHAAPVSQGDVTLGAAFLKANKAYQNEVIKNARLRKLEGVIDAQELSQARKKLAAERNKAMNEAILAENQAYQTMLKKKAVSMGCACEKLSTPMSGNGMTANGLRGFAGMSRDQQIIHRHLMGLGADPSSMISKDEVALRLQHSKNLRDATIKAMSEQNKKRLQSKR